PLSATAPHPRPLPAMLRMGGGEKCACGELVAAQEAEIVRKPALTTWRTLSRCREPPLPTRAKRVAGRGRGWGAFHDDPSRGSRYGRRLRRLRARGVRVFR